MVGPDRRPDGVGRRKHLSHPHQHQWGRGNNYCHFAMLVEKDSCLSLRGVQLMRDLQTVFEMASATPLRPICLSMPDVAMTIIVSTLSCHHTLQSQGDIVVPKLLEQHGSSSEVNGVWAFHAGDMCWCYGSYDKG